VCHINYIQTVCIVDCFFKKLNLLFQGTGPCVGSQVHLVVGCELPPSYESVVSHDTPPPYCSVQILNEKLTHGMPAAAAAKQATGWRYHYCINTWNGCEKNLHEKKLTYT